ncbi:MBL fold metallo-hydrolase [Actinocatenispora rupis]
MRVTVLGSCGAWPEAGRACSGFLVEAGGRRLVVDLGYGTAPRLSAAVPVETLSAVVVTHAHPDHWIDLHALFRARYYGHRGTGLPPLPVYLPAGLTELLVALEGEGGPEPLRETFTVREYAAGEVVDLDGLRVALVPLPHYVPNMGVRVEGDGAVFAYTGDTGPAAEVADLGAGADLFAVDATFQDRPVATVTPAPRYNLTAREAGLFAARAMAHRLLLTHFWPGADRHRSRAEAAGSYDGEILLADEGLVIPLT